MAIVDINVARRRRNRVSRAAKPSTRRARSARGSLKMRAAVRYGVIAVMAAVVATALLSRPDTLGLPTVLPGISTTTNQGLTGRVQRVADGDTLTVADTQIRLHGIDAPELSTHAGALAKRQLTELIRDGAIRCDDTGERSYDRIVAICFGGDGRDLAAMMVEEGWAVDWPRYSGGRYSAAQRRAEHARRGMHAGQRSAYLAR